MQTGSAQLRAQQEIMQALNMYNGKIDGIWGPATIAAKQKWERSGKFSPAIPNNGFPLNERGPFPPGVRRQIDGTLTCLALASKESQPAAQASPQQNNQQNQNRNQQNNNQNRNQQQGKNQGNQQRNPNQTPTPAAIVTPTEPAAVPVQPEVIPVVVT
jgi:hypothetical protein